jgi:hypothetical protein
VYHESKYFGENLFGWGHSKW